MGGVGRDSSDVDGLRRHRAVLGRYSVDRQPHGIAIDDDGIIYVADRLNGRLQRFDLVYSASISRVNISASGTNLGKVTTVVIRDGALWIGTQQRNEPTGADGWIMKIDRKTGRILGYVESAHGHHMVNVSKSGDLLWGARPDTVLWSVQLTDAIEQGRRVAHRLILVEPPSVRVQPDGVLTQNLQKPLRRISNLAIYFIHHRGAAHRAAAGHWPASRR